MPPERCDVFRIAHIKRKFAMQGIRRSLRIVPVLATTLLCLMLSGIGYAGRNPNSESGTDDHRIVVRICQVSKMSVEQLAQAEEVAGEILQKFGVEPIWLNCIRRGESATHRPVFACAAASIQAFLRVNIVDWFPPELKNVSSEALELSVLPSEANSGRFAYISMPRVKQFASEEEVPPSMLLGIVLAHEIGHLLLGTASHLPAELMAAGITRTALTRAREGLLLFSPGESERLRWAVEAGTKQLSNSQVRSSSEKGHRAD
jgi:hypothetical protein